MNNINIELAKTFIAKLILQREMEIRDDNRNSIIILLLIQNTSQLKEKLQ